MIERRKTHLRHSRPSAQATPMVRIYQVLRLKKEEEEKFVEICLGVSFRIYNYELIKKL